MEAEPDRRPGPGGQPPAGEIDRMLRSLREGALPQARDDAERITRRFPADPVAWAVLGRALGRMGSLQHAVPAFERALSLTPADADLHNDLGYTLALLGRLGESEARLRRAAILSPGHSQALITLGAVVRRLGRPGEAREWFERAVLADPSQASAHNNLANTLAQLGRLAEAEASYLEALRLAPDYAEAHCNLAIAMQQMGRLEEAEAGYRRALELQPGLLDAHSGLLLCTSYRDPDPARSLSDARQYGRAVAAMAPDPYTFWLCQREPSRLRVGMVSGDLGDHAVGHFLEGVLARIDPARVELLAYPTFERGDGVAQRLKARFAQWRPLRGLDDAAAARRIHDDAVHVLLDLSGHTAYNRLPVFARRPAPVQVAWMGHAATTGVDAIDYILADPHTVPEGAEPEFTERVWRLDDTRLCFTPPRAAAPVAPLPALSGEPLTFGCFNNASKIGEPVVRTWAAVLAAVPGSRLLLKSRQLGDDVVRALLRERFAAAGVDPRRLLLQGPSARDDYLAAYAQVDIALDPFPFAGGTVSAEALWMGVPVVTLAGRRLVARQGVGLLACAGLQDWIATGEEDYVRCAATHAAGLPRLAALRAELRPRLLASPVFDAALFASRLQDAFWSMWERWRLRHG